MSRVPPVVAPAALDGQERSPACAVDRRIFLPASCPQEKSFAPSPQATVTPLLLPSRGEPYPPPACLLAAMGVSLVPLAAAGSSTPLPARASALACSSRPTEQNANQDAGYEPREQLPATWAGAPGPSSRSVSAPARAAGKSEHWPPASVRQPRPPLKPPARRIPANRPPGSNRSARPSKAKGSVASPINRAPLPVPVSGKPPGKEKLRSLRSTQRRPIGDTSKPAATTRSPARWRRPSPARRDGAPASSPSAPAGLHPQTPG
jgi:hypothetical protein